MWVVRGARRRDRVLAVIVTALAVTMMSGFARAEAEQAAHRRVVAAGRRRAERRADLAPVRVVAQSVHVGARARAIRCLQAAGARELLE